MEHILEACGTWHRPNPHSHGGHLADLRAPASVLFRAETCKLVRTTKILPRASRARNVEDLGAEAGVFQPGNHPERVVEVILSWYESD